MKNKKEKTSFEMYKSRLFDMMAKKGYYFQDVGEVQTIDIEILMDKSISSLAKITYFLHCVENIIDEEITNSILETQEEILAACEECEKKGLLKKQ